MFEDDDSDGDSPSKRPRSDTPLPTDLEIYMLIQICNEKLSEQHFSIHGRKIAMSFLRRVLLGRMLASLRNSLRLLRQLNLSSSDDDDDDSDAEDAAADDDEDEEDDVQVVIDMDYDHVDFDADLSRDDVRSSAEEHDKNDANAAASDSRDCDIAQLPPAVTMKQQFNQDLPFELFNDDNPLAEIDTTDYVGNSQYSEDDLDEFIKKSLFF